MRKQFQSPGQLQLNFESSCLSEIAHPLKPSNVVQIDFGRDVTSDLRAKQSNVTSQSETAMIDQILDRARRLNW